MNNRQRIFCYIDGYNLYRSIRHRVIQMGYPQQIWYDLVKLAQQFSGENQDVVRVYYCSAPYSHYDDNKEDIPQKIKDTLRAQEVFCDYHQNLYGEEIFKVKYGYFNSNTSRSGKPFFTEKQTDVNLALLALDDAHNNLYDHAFIFSGDSDFAPLADFILKLNKKVSFILPPVANNAKIFDKFDTRVIKGEHIKASQFDPGANAPDPLNIY